MSIRAFDENDATDFEDGEKETAEQEWKTVMGRLQNAEGNPLLPAAVSDATYALNVLLTWCWEPATRKAGKPAKNLEMVGRRVAALLWVVGPERFEDASMTRFARQFGMHKAVFSEYTASFSRQFGIRNSKQLHAGNFKPEGKGTSK